MMKHLGRMEQARALVFARRCYADDDNVVGDQFMRNTDRFEIMFDDFFNLSE